MTGYTIQNEGFLHQEDNVTIILDTFLDHRNAYYFWTNPLGVRTDGRIVDDGEAFSTNWAGEWETKATASRTGGTPRSASPSPTSSSRPKDRRDVRHAPGPRAVPHPGVEQLDAGRREQRKVAATRT